LKRISIENAQEGMILGEPIRDEFNNILLNSGVKITANYIHKLKRMGYLQLTVGGDPDTDDIIMEANISVENRNMASRQIKQSFDVAERMTAQFKNESVENIRKNIQQPKFQKVFAKSQVFKEIQNFVKTLVEDILGNKTLSGLNSLKTHDNYTFNHSIDVTITSIFLGKQVGMDSIQLKDLATGGLIHDIGKVFVDKSIINSSAKLTDEQFQKMRVHPEMGYELIKNAVSTMAAQVAYQHHEKQNGTGYPRGLKGLNSIRRSGHEQNVISLMGDVTAVADVHDALISDRSYKKGLPPDQVIKILRNGSGIHFNREILNVFLKGIPMFPVGTGVIIGAGQYKGYIGIVSFVDSGNINLPTIRILSDEKKQRIKAFEIDMRKDPMLQVKSVPL
jgi:HD-GYP domain-containing protein (c-di-GMP phosphodiesterase class II)